MKSTRLHEGAAPSFCLLGIIIALSAMADHQSALSLLNADIFSWVKIVALIPLAIIPSSRITWLIAAIGMTTHLCYSAPHFANHNLLHVLIAWLAVFLFHKPKEVIKCAILALGTVYLASVFHKLNSDFFVEPQSCVYKSFSNLGLTGSPLFPFEYAKLIDNALGDSQHIAMFWSWIAATVLLLEFFLGLSLLLLTRWIWASMVLALLFHGFIGHREIVSFSTFCIGIFLTRIVLLYEQEVLHSKLNKAAVVFQFLFAMRIFVLLVLMLANNSWNYIWHIHSVLWIFILTVLTVSMWRFLASKSLSNASKKMQRWDSCSILICLALVMNASSPYLGIKISNSFAMYSNLRVEGGHGNHLILGKLPVPFPFLGCTSIATTQDPERPLIQLYISYVESIGPRDLSIFDRIQCNGREISDAKERQEILATLMNHGWWLKYLTVRDNLSESVGCRW